MRGDINRQFPHLVFIKTLHLFPTTNLTKLTLLGGRGFGGDYLRLFEIHKTVGPEKPIYKHEFFERLR